jgi:hypothetical protein
VQLLSGSAEASKVKNSNDDWAWQDVSFAEWRSAVDRRLKEIYAITIEDDGIDDEFLTSHWEMKQSPHEFV